MLVKPIRKEETMDEKRETPEEVDRAELDGADLKSVSGGDPGDPPGGPPNGDE